MDVVAAAIVRDGRVLAARRVRPSALAGGWEFPGGKVEPGESGPDALTRECREELGVGVRVGPVLGRAGDGRIALVLYRATLTDGAPAAGADHDALCWIGPAELDGLGWLPIDRDLLPTVARLIVDPNRPSDTN
jgi:8-oxo-dGTP diphosphatase